MLFNASDQQKISSAAQIIKNGGVVAFPTHSLYGMAADALNPQAVEKIFRLKNRDLKNPLLILIHDVRQLDDLVKRIPDAARRLMDTFWPGCVTLVFEASGHLPDNLTSKTGKIGIRLAGHPAARMLAEAAGSPLTGTSANLTGQPGCRDISNLNPVLKASLDLILDAGLLKEEGASTVVDITGDKPVIIREGRISQPDIFAALKN